MQSITKIFKLLSDETRLRIIILLHQDAFCVCQLTGILNITQPNVSKALSKLRDLDLVTDTRKEKFIYYKLKTDNPLLINTVSNILTNVKQYPEIQRDLDKISEKENYISICQIDTVL